MKKPISKELLFFIGLIGNAIAFNFLLKADFGLACMSSLPYVIQKTLPSISIGMMNFIIQSICLIVIMLITKKPSIYYGLSFVVALVFGIIADIFKIIFNDFPNEMIFRIIYFIIGWVLLVYTLVWFMYCDMPLLPFDIFIRDIAKFKNINPGKIKNISDIVFASLSIVISCIAFGKLYGVGFATIFQALFTGKFEIILIKRFLHKYEPCIYTKAGKLLSNIKAI